MCCMAAGGVGPKRAASTPALRWCCPASSMSEASGARKGTSGPASGASRSSPKRDENDGNDAEPHNKRHARAAHTHTPTAPYGEDSHYRHSAGLTAGADDNGHDFEAEGRRRFGDDA